MALHDDSDYDSSLSYPTDYTSDDSITSSVFNFVCKICFVRAVKQTHLEFQFLDEEIYLIDIDKDTRIKCHQCNSAFHRTCWETFSQNIPIPFICCEYQLFFYLWCTFKLLSLEPHFIEKWENRILNASGASPRMMIRTILNLKFCKTQKTSKTT